jgi:hypothetical protein
MRIVLPFLCLLTALPLAATVAKAPKSPRTRIQGTVKNAKDAKTISERETGGIAVSARQVPLNGASGGWEVDVHMPKEDRGWRCTVDSDTRQVHTKDRIPNPKPPRGRGASR